MRKEEKQTQEFTSKAKREKAWQQYHILPRFNSFGTPTYRFTKGDHIACGHLQNCVVDDVKEENGITIYGFSYEGKNGEDDYMYAPWYAIRPIPKTRSNTSFTQENDIRIRFMNTTVESLLNKFYLHGVNMNPEYQRDYVWDDADKEALLDSVFSHIEIGKFAFINKGYESNMLYEILDGKQRLSTLLDFYENRLSYKGVYFNDLSPIDKHTFLETTVAVGETEKLTKEQIYRYFYTLNKSGRVMDEEHLEHIRDFIDKCEKEEIEKFTDDEEIER